jgi:putative DNA primase/helicase
MNARTQEIGCDDFELPPKEAYEDESGETTSAAAERVVIQLEAGALHRYADAAEQIIAREVYTRGGKLVRIGTSPELQGFTGSAVRRDARQSVLVPISAEYMRRRLNELAEFQTFRRRESEWIAVDCPKDLAGNILNSGEWPHFRPLTAIASAPFIRPDHTVCEASGYDAATGIFLAPNERFPRVPVRPTRDDAVRARQRLLDPFSDFPFENAESLAAFAAHVLTSAVRAALGTTPVFLYTAPIAASGKTLLSSQAHAIAHGVAPAMRPWTDESEEIRKVLYATLLAGDAALTFDNVPAGVRVRSAVLCGFATAATYSDRKLGSSETTSLPNRCSVTLTGNNVTPSGDLARRSLVCRLDANAESPRGREFRIANLPAYVSEHRAKLLMAALTIVRAYTAAGLPDVGLKPLESFEGWTRLVRDPLVWIGMADPVDTQATETDDEIAPLRAAFTALESEGEFTARQLAEAANRIGNSDLRSVIEGAGCSDASDHVRIGYWLRANRGRVADGRKLANRSGHAGLTYWKVTRQ